MSLRLWTKWLWVRLSCSHFRFRACLEQGVAWHSDNHRVWIHSDSYRQMHRTDKYPQHSSIIWRPVWLNGWVLVYKLSSCGFESNCSHLEWLSFIKLWWHKKIIFLQMHNTILQRVLGGGWVHSDLTKINLFVKSNSYHQSNHFMILFVVAWSSIS